MHWVGTTATITKMFLPIKFFPTTPMSVTIYWMYNAIKMGNFQRKSRFWISELFHVTRNWYDPQLWHNGSSQLVTNRNDFILKGLDSKPFSWIALNGAVGLLFNAKLISSPVCPNYTIQDTTNTSFFSDVSQSLWRKADNKLKHTHHYNSIISVLKEQAANPLQMSIIFTTLTRCH